MGEGEERRGPHSEDEILQVLLAQQYVSKYEVDPNYAQVYLWLATLVQLEGD